MIFGTRLPLNNNEDENNFLMYLLIIPVCLQAQIEQYTRVLEPSVLVCQYECVKKVDTLGTDKNCETMILRIGKR